MYILIGVQFEERTLSDELGAEYQAYRTRTPMLIPMGRPVPAHHPEATEASRTG
jgi:hypothetical protein